MLFSLNICGMKNDCNVHAVLFDLDGVVIDSNAEIEVFWQGWAAKAGVVLDKPAIEKYILGRTTTETIETLFPDADADKIAAILKAAKAFDVSMRPQLLAGVQHFLQQLYTAGVPIGLVTSSPKERAGLMLAQHHIAHFFTAIVTGEDVQKGKPHPEPYLTMAAKLHVPPVSCLVFEDSDSGIQSALAAGMQVIAIGNHNFTETLGVLADYTSLSVADSSIKCAAETLPRILLG